MPWRPPQHFASEGNRREDYKKDERVCGSVCARDGGVGSMKIPIFHYAVKKTGKTQSAKQNSSTYQLHL
jgi:hypothetical protein